MSKKRDSIAKGLTLKAMRRLLSLATLSGDKGIITADVVGEYPKFRTTAQAADFLSRAEQWKVFDKREREISGDGDERECSRIRTFVNTSKLQKLLGEEHVATTIPGKKRLGRPRKASGGVILSPTQLAEVAAPVRVYRRSDVFADAMSTLRTTANQAVLAGALDMIAAIESRGEREKFAAEVKKLTTH